jgi:hypothetical protein
MAACQYCQTGSAVKDLLPGEETTCFWCGKRMVGEAPAAPLVTAPKSESKTATVAAKADDRRTIPLAGPREPNSVPEAESSDPSRLGEAKLATAFLCGALALCFASFPAVSWLTKPLSGVGLAVGIFGCWLPARKQGNDLWLPSAIVGLSAVVLVFVGTWATPTPAAPEPLVALSLNPDENARQPLDDGQWTDASSHAVSLHDLRVQVVSARIENVLLDKQGSQLLSPDKYLVIRLRASFEGVVFKQFPYERWADAPTVPSKHPPTLVDDEDHPYTQAEFGPDLHIAASGAPAAYVIYGRPISETLVFPAPSNSVESWQLTLPAGAFGLAGEFKFRIPRSMVESSQ